MRAPRSSRATKPATVKTCAPRRRGCSATSSRARRRPPIRWRSSSSSPASPSRSICRRSRKASTRCAATSRAANARRDEKRGMRALLWLIAVFAAAVALVILGRVDAGYVLFVYPPYRVEVTMLFFVLAAAATFAMLYALARLFGRILALPATVRAYRARRRRERGPSALAAGLQAYYEGRYRRAERQAALAYDLGTVPGLAALLAARAAHQMRNFQDRDPRLERADPAGTESQTARLVSRAELALEERDFGAARDALRRVQTEGPRHIAAARMLLRAARGAGAWDEVLRLA